MNEQTVEITHEIFDENFVVKKQYPCPKCDLIFAFLIFKKGLHFALEKTKTLCLLHSQLHHIFESKLSLFESESLVCLLG